MKIVLATAHLDARFSRSDPLNETYMLFGGGHLDHPDAVSNVTLAGLPAGEAVTQHYGNNHFYLVTSAEMVDCRQAR
jgi:hypothetical protein